MNLRIENGKLVLYLVEDHRENLHGEPANENELMEMLRDWAWDGHGINI